MERFSWLVLRNFGKNKVLNSSYVWVILVPILAKLMEQFPNSITMNIFENKIIIPMELPFSWIIFYFSAICFFIASIIFQLSCPNIIKQFSNFSDFLSSGESGRYFITQKEKFFHSKDNKKEWKFILKSYIFSKFSNEEIINLLPKFGVTIMPKMGIPYVFVVEPEKKNKLLSFLCLIILFYVYQEKN